MENGYNAEGIPVSSTGTPKKEEKVEKNNNKNNKCELFIKIREMIRIGTPTHTK